ncbi:MAG: response regulator [Bacteroidia bacterium]|nr:response regulator [Bacteroidia bacterium]
MFTNKDEFNNSISKKTESLSVKFSLLGLAASLFYALLFGIIGQINLITYCLLLAAMMGWAYISNRQGRIDPFRIITIFVLNVSVFFIDLILGRNTGLFLLFIPLMGASFVLFSSNEKFKVFSMVALSLLCIAALELTNHKFIFEQVRLDRWKNYTLFYGSLFTSIFAIAFIIIKLRETNIDFEKVLRQQKNFFEKIFDEMPTDLVVFNGKREYAYLNHAAVKDSEMRKWMIGKTETEYMNFRKKTAEFVKIRDRAFHDVLTSKRVIEFEEAIVDRRGKTHHFIRRMHPILSDTQEVLFVIGYGIEITPQKEAQISLLHSKLMAEQTAKAKSNFLSNVSHEIRTPLNAILGMSDLLIQSPSVNLQENLHIIKESADNLLALIDDILDLSKFDEGKINLENKPFNLKHLLNEIAQKTEWDAKNKNLEFKAEYGNDIPEIVNADMARVRQILLNITVNAVKFTKTGCITIKTTCKTAEAGKQVIDFIISDTGIGIPASKKEEIFDSFTQAEGYTNRKYGGTGLGLNISRKFCQLMGGKISVESALGKGSTFTVSIPFEVADSDTVSGEEAQPFTEADLPKGTFDCRVLMAEDNMVNQKLAIQLFKKWGVNLKMASNGKEALRMIQDQEYDIVLMDLQMPEMDGITATKKIRNGEAGEKNKNISVIALTADVFEESRKKANEAGFDQKITKPYSNTELMEKMLLCKNRKLKK